MQIKKELKEKKETIINPNTEDTTTNEEFQKVIETAVQEKNEEVKEDNEDTKNEKSENKTTDVKEEIPETSVFLFS